MHRSRSHPCRWTAWCRFLRCCVNAVFSTSPWAPVGDGVVRVGVMCVCVGGYVCLGVWGGVYGSGSGCECGSGTSVRKCCYEAEHNMSDTKLMRACAT